MLMRDILEGRLLTGLARVVMSSIYMETLMLQADSHNSKEFEGRLLESYGLDDSLKMSKKDLMDLVKLPRKQCNTPTILQQFKKRFVRR